MKTLIAYGTTEGHTRKIVNHMKETIEAGNGSCELFDCGSLDQKPNPADFDAVIIAGSVHQESHQSTVAEFVKENLSALKKTPSALVSVSLSVSLEGGLPEAEKYVSDFSKETGWKPNETLMAAGAIRSLEYDFFQRFTVEHMLMKDKNMPGKAEGNPEYTDWEELEAFVKAFIEKAAA